MTYIKRIDGSQMTGYREPGHVGFGGKRNAVTFPKDGKMWDWVHTLAKDNNRNFSEQVIILLQEVYDDKKIG